MRTRLAATAKACRAEFEEMGLAASLWLLTAMVLMPLGMLFVGLSLNTEGSRIAEPGSHGAGNLSAANWIWFAAAVVALLCYFVTSAAKVHRRSGGSDQDDHGEPSG